MAGGDGHSSVAECMLSTHKDLCSTSSTNEMKTKTTTKKIQQTKMLITGIDYGQLHEGRQRNWRLASLPIGQTVVFAQISVLLFSFGHVFFWRIHSPALSTCRTFSSAHADSQTSFFRKHPLTHLKQCPLGFLGVHLPNVLQFS